MLLNTFSSDAGISGSRGRKLPSIFFFNLLPLLLAFVSSAATAPQGAGSQVHNQAPATESSSWKLELRARQEKLGAAKQSGDPAAICDASGKLIAWTLRQIGRRKLIEGVTAEASEDYRRSIDFEDSPETRVELSAAYRAIQATTKERQSAKAEERELSKILASALNDLGATEARQKKFDLALAHFHEAERWHSNTPGLMRNTGMAAARLSDYPEAVRALRPVVLANPGDVLARSVLGTSLYSTQNFTEAVRVFTPLGDSALREPELTYAWADSLIKTTQFAQATALLSKLEKQSLPPETLVLVAQAWSQMGNYPRAIESCHKALRLDPKLAQAHFIAGMARIRSDHPAEAIAEFRAQLELDPDNNDAEYHLAFALLQLSRSDEAVGLLRSVLGRDPNHAQANYELGRELLTEGKKEEAIRYLEAAARLNPQLDAVHYQLQSAYRAVGRIDDADHELKIYREMKSKNRNVNVTPMGQPARE